eukprot:CAMPEP_0115600936 /NCGR_PEP_ID=MMETSP0272-20121206/15143_1 /TAXON_ID=71861 /ORGANISM="Scrippsiella trochoidea, Strain CCMP3099" /LENGTH=80 /DNA_ID=CAMNT_0003036391 /DNA_START=1 /DNA_END=240 /DNA_ORIENTATION=-
MPSDPASTYRVFTQLSTEAPDGVSDCDEARPLTPRLDERDLETPGLASPARAGTNSRHVEAIEPSPRHHRQPLLPQQQSV